MNMRIVHLGMGGCMRCCAQLRRKGIAGRDDDEDTAEEAPVAPKKKPAKKATSTHAGDEEAIPLPPKSADRPAEPADEEEDTPPHAQVCT